MGYDSKTLHAALLRFEEQKQQREEAFRRRENEILQREPRLLEIRTELAGTVTEIMTKALRTGADTEKALAEIKRKNLALQQERAMLLRLLGYPEDALTPDPACPLCRDTGYTDKGMCGCLKKIYLEEQRKSLSRFLDVEGQSFDSFSLDKYSTEAPWGDKSPYEMAEKAKDTCFYFAHRFGTHSQNLFLFGAPGTGKTHLSAAIARLVSDKGYSVVYDTASHIFAGFEQEKFNRESEEDRLNNEGVMKADLLIIDDLGTEMLTEFVKATLYTIINTRLIEKRCTIINTNLRSTELEDRYSPAIASRLLGKYTGLPFIGDDLRKKK